MLSFLLFYFSRFKLAGGSIPFRQRSITTTACVLPGGKIRPAGSRLHPSSKAIPVHGSSDSRRKKRVQTSSSWHGWAHDMSDFLLDDYEVIGKEAIEQAAMSDIESISTSETSHSPQHFDSNSCQSSDDGIEIDITERLKEYNIISLAESPIFSWDQQLSFYE